MSFDASRSIVFGYFSSFYFSDVSDVYDRFHQTLLDKQKYTGAQHLGKIAI